MLLRKILFTEPWTRILGIPFVGMLMTYVHKEPPYVFMDYAISTLFTFVIWQGDYFIIKGMRRRFPSLAATNKRILLTILFVAPYNFIADFMTCEALFRIGIKESNNWDAEYLGKLASLFIATFIIGTLYETGYFYSMWRKQSVITEQVRSQKLKSELSVLKNQVSPHFLFNSLNTLVALIPENQKLAASFTEKLSDVYRYILQMKDKEIVELRTELEFTKAYCFLLEMRFEKGLNINFNIDTKYESLYVVPLTLQMLVENSVKHNIVSASSPLSIDIYIENGKSIIVRNNLNRKRNVENSLKTGLENIKKRYSLLSEREVDVIESREYFMVAMPILTVDKTPEELIQSEDESSDSRR